MKTLEFRENALWLIDQTKLPLDPVVIRCTDYHQVAEAITSLRVRGAPAIGIAAAYGVVLAARNLVISGVTGDRVCSELGTAIDELRRTRPTAVNLSWALERMRGVALETADATPDALADSLLAEADRICEEDAEASRRMARHAAELIPDGASVLTHCNTGSLVSAASGTALAALREAHDQGKRVHVWVDETRPLLQGARLTAWELKEAEVPFTLITDSMAAHFMARGRVDLVMVGADRIVANGDTANKIGTYGLAVLARAHGIPFYFVAPISTVDLSTRSGDQITIEERQPSEVTTFGGVRTAPKDIQVSNPAFDVTPAGLITALVTELGVLHPPFEEGLARATRSRGLATVPRSGQAGTEHG